MKRIAFLIPLFLLSALTGCNKKPIDYTMSYKEFKLFLSGDTSYTSIKKEKSTYHSTAYNSEADFNAETKVIKCNNLYHMIDEYKEYLTFTTQNYMDFLHYGPDQKDEVESILRDMENTECIDEQQGIWKKLDSDEHIDVIQKYFNEEYTSFDNLTNTYEVISEEEEPFRTIYLDYFCTKGMIEAVYNEENHYYELDDVDELKGIKAISKDSISGSLRFYFEDKKPVKIILHSQQSKDYYEDKVIEFSQVGSSTIELDETKYKEKE